MTAFHSSVGDSVCGGGNSYRWLRGAWIVANFLGFQRQSYDGTITTKKKRQGSQRGAKENIPIKRATPYNDIERAIKWAMGDWMSKPSKTNDHGNYTEGCKVSEIAIEQTLQDG